MPHASPTTTTVMAFPVSFGLSSTVRNRNSAPIPKITNASVWLAPVNSAITAPTTPRSISALRSSRSASGSTSDARRGCHAITHAQPTAKSRLRKRRNIKSGCPNCSTLCWIETQELPLGSMPLLFPILASSSAGLAPKATEHNMPAKAITTTTPTIRSVDSKRRLNEKKCAGFIYSYGWSSAPFSLLKTDLQVESCSTCSFRWSYLFSLAASWRQFFASAQLSLACYCEILRSYKIKLSYLIGWHSLPLVPHQSHIPP